MGLSVSSSKQLQYLQAMHLKRLQLQETQQRNKSATINPEPSYRQQEQDKIGRIHTSPNQEIPRGLQQTIDYDGEDTLPPTQRRIARSQNSNLESKATSDPLVIRSSKRNEAIDKPVNTRAKKVNLNKKK